MHGQLHVEVWMRKAVKGYQYRGMVRRGTDYLYTGEWLGGQMSAAYDANKACTRIIKKERRNVQH